MGFKKSYFDDRPSDPEPLLAEVSPRVRFEEVDLLGMVWHGRYPSYFEDGRAAFGDRYGLSYHAFRENLTVAPVVQMHLDYRSPLRFDEQLTVETRLHWSDAAKINFSYMIYNAKAKIAATGYTVQLLTETDGTIILVQPEWILEFQKKWKEGYWSN